MTTFAPNNAAELAKFREAMRQAAQKSATFGWPVLIGGRK